MTYELTEVQESPSVKQGRLTYNWVFIGFKSTNLSTISEVQFTWNFHFLHVAWPQTLTQTHTHTRLIGGSVCSHNTKVYFWHLVVISSNSECPTADNTQCPCWGPAGSVRRRTSCEKCLRPAAQRFFSQYCTGIMFCNQSQKPQTKFCSKMRAIRFAVQNSHAPPAGQEQHLRTSNDFSHENLSTGFWEWNCT